MNTLFLAAQYLNFHRWRTVILIAAVTLVMYLPLALHVIVSESSDQLTRRADATPLLLGHSGSPVELTLSALYFSSTENPPLTYAAVDLVENSGLADAIPLHTRFRSRGFPIVGTRLDYFAFRDLTPRQGRLFLLPGEAVIGARVAEQLQLSIGDSLISSPETVFDVSGVYPLKMTIVGILRPAHSPDDSAILVDIRTSWIIQGLVHGHQDLARPDARGTILKRDGENIVANASVIKYNEITAENLASFHFHGDSSSYPVNAVIPVTGNDRDKALLLGRFTGHSPQMQLLEPRHVIAELIATLLQIERYVQMAVLLIGIATALVIALVFALSHRLRSGEFATLRRIGSSSRQLFILQAAEIGLVLATSMVLTLLLTAATYQWGTVLMQAQFL